eukprot:gnl/Trimastix_PCT/3881.p1 GENE.gnl/Trimastix_PCT/3881~~gnl/Trimastix_PCT/3881.p1  ORF type:complete len:303 (+),score=52.55 gnl/Trimastix_PCT/3881:177-1085(+)
MPSKFFNQIGIRCTLPKQLCEASFTMKITEFPLDILSLIFTPISIHNIRNISMTCRRFARAIRDPMYHFWRNKCIAQGIWNSDSPLPDSDWRDLFRRSMNLLQNPLGGRGDWEGWRYEQGGDGWLMENRNAFDCPALQHLPSQLRNCYVTSFGWCTRTQTLTSHRDYLSRGLPITFGAWVKRRWDCGSTFKITLTLHFERGEEQRHTLEGTEELTPEWQLFHATVWAERPGCVSIEYSERGKDTKFWAGHYGAKFAGSFVTLATRPPPLPEPTESEFIQLVGPDGITYPTVRVPEAELPACP